jgi:hypothetical protein
MHNVLDVIAVDMQQLERFLEKRAMQPRHQGHLRRCSRSPHCHSRTVQAMPSHPGHLDKKMHSIPRSKGGHAAPSTATWILSPQRCYGGMCLCPRAEDQAEDMMADNAVATST